MLSFSYFMTLLAISTAQRFQRLRFEDPVCYEEAKPCNVKYINTKIYIEEELYRKVDEYRKNRKINQSLNDIIRGRLNKMFSNTNHQLINLDNGGYRAGYDGTFSLLNSSDVTLGQSYVDRNDGNRRKTLRGNEKEVDAWIFTFQEAVQKLDNSLRNSVDIRILMRHFRGNNYVASSEEDCICNFNWPYGCVSTYTVDETERSWLKGSLFAHEFGHSLGAGAVHDDQTYGYNPTLIMNTEVNPGARIWSPRAKKLIREQGQKYHSCLKELRALK